MELYIERELHALVEARKLDKSWASDDQIKKLVNLSGGLFIWSRTIFDYLRRGVSTLKKLQSLLQQTPGGSAEAKMDKLYAHILETCPWDDEDFVIGFQTYIGAIVAAKTPMSLSVLQSLHPDALVGAEEIIPFMGSLLSGWSDSASPIQFLHVSLHDFLTSRSDGHVEFQGFYLSKQEQSRRLAGLCLHVLTQQSNEGIAGANFLWSLSWEEELPTISQEEENMSEALQYASQYLVNHLLDIEDSDITLFNDLERFISKHMLLWVELTVLRWRLPDLKSLRLWLYVSLIYLLEAHRVRSK
jgi:hypothetical protein